MGRLQPRRRLGTTSACWFSDRPQNSPIGSNCRHQQGALGHLRLSHHFYFPVLTASPTLETHTHAGGDCPPRGRAVSAPACLRSPRSGFEFKSAGRQTIPQKNIPIPSVTSPSHTAHRGGSAPPHRAHPQRQASSSTPHHPPLSAAQQSMTHSGSTAPSFVYHDTSCFQFTPVSVPHPLTLTLIATSPCCTVDLAILHLNISLLYC